METCTPGGTWGGSDKSVTVPTRVCEGTPLVARALCFIAGWFATGGAPCTPSGGLHQSQPACPFKERTPTNFVLDWSLSTGRGCYARSDRGSGLLLYPRGSGSGLRGN